MQRLGMPLHFFQGDLKKEDLVNSKYSGCLLTILSSFGNFNKNQLNSQRVVSWVIKDYNLGCKLCGLMITRETVITNKISFHQVQLRPYSSVPLP